jgi:hypothetical protein
MLSGELRKAGYQVQFDPPEERRGAVEESVSIAINVAVGVGSAALYDGAKQVVKAFKDRHPEAKAEVQAEEA